MATNDKVVPEKTVQNQQSNEQGEGDIKTQTLTSQEQKRLEVEEGLLESVSDEETTKSEEEADTPKEDETAETEEKEFPGAEKRKEELQKEIDQLIAQKKALLAEQEKEPEKKEDEPKKEEPKQYSETALWNTYKKAMEEGDYDVAWQAQKTFAEQYGRQLVQSYEKKQQDSARFAAIQQKEWADIQRDYADDTNKDLDIRDGNSLLSKIARRLYTDKDTAREYQGRIGGMKDCIADAYRLVTKRKGNKKDEGLLKEENEALKSKLGKKNRANSMGGGADGPGEEGMPASAPLSDAQLLDEYIKERRADRYKRDRSGLE
jgi:hypothetical protein